MSESWEDVEQGIRDLTDKGNDYLSAQTRERPHDGQPQTVDGKRGEQELSGVTMRDVKDAFVVGAILAGTSGGPGSMDWVLGKAPHPCYSISSIYELPWDDMDPVAVIQNACVELEKRMGIYPNVPRLEYTDDEGDE